MMDFPIFQVCIWPVSSKNTKELIHDPSRHIWPFWGTGWWGKWLGCSLTHHSGCWLKKAVSKDQDRPVKWVHPGKLTCPLIKRDYFGREYIWSNHWFSGDMLVFRGVASFPQFSGKNNEKEVSVSEQLQTFVWKASWLQVGHRSTNPSGTEWLALGERLLWYFLTMK